VSRQLAATRKVLRTDVEGQLRRDSGLGDAELADCLRSVAEDAGPIDLAEILEVAGSAGERKKSPLDRSEERATP
jgi:hypothetical protein